MADYAFDVGERVLIRPDLRNGRYGFIWCNAIMLSYRGEEATIIRKFRTLGGGHEYIIDRDNGEYLWNDGMLIPCNTDVDIEEDGSFEEFFSGFVYKNTATWIN